MSAPGTGAWRAAHSDAVRTGYAAIAGALGIVPLSELFRDHGWLVTAWLTMAIVLGPAFLLRLRSPARSWHLLPGLVLGLFWLTARFVPDHALLRFIPGPGGWHDVGAQITSLHQTIDTGVAPIHTTTAVELAVCTLAGVLAALIDLVGVVARHGALAGVPLLVVYTVSGAVPRHPVGWVLFAAAAAGFLLLLGLDANDDIASWGRFIPRAGSARTRLGLGVSAQRIAIIAVAVAVLLPLVAPSRPTNVIANAFHGHAGDSANGLGVSLDPFADLSGDLGQSKPVNLFTVTLDSTPAQEPFYLRSAVLNDFLPTGWIAGPRTGVQLPLNEGFATDPPTSGGAVAQVSYQAAISVSGLADSPPIFGVPTQLAGLDGPALWNRSTGLVSGVRVSRGDRYTESVQQPNPSAKDLQNSPALPADEPTVLGGSVVGSALTDTAAVPAAAKAIVAQLTAGDRTPYEKTLAIFNYFSTSNGFSYDLHTVKGDSGSDLLDFLKNKSGFCQQYAAAMGIMLRVAGVPARVVLGYMHPPASGNGNSFTVTTADAHAWVEAYFAGVGWVPFDPTPLSGIDGGSAADLPWAAHPSAANNSVGPARDQSTNAKGASGSGSVPTAATSSAAAAAGARTPGPDLWPLVWVLLGVVVVLGVLLLPAWARWRRRRRRLHAARRGDPDPLWAELSATAVDLGYVWSPARSPRQVVRWLSADLAGPGRGAGPELTGLSDLAARVEAARYAPAGASVLGPAGPTRASRRDGVTLVRELREVEASLRASRTRTARIWSRLLPASLGWHLPGVGARRR